MALKQIKRQEKPDMQTFKSNTNKKFDSKLNKKKRITMHKRMFAHAME